MSNQLTRRGLFGLFRPRPRANASGGTDTQFSLEDFYRRRAADGAAQAPVPRRAPRADLSARRITTTSIGVPDLVAGRRKP